MEHMGQMWSKICPYGPTMKAKPFIFWGNAHCFGKMCTFFHALKGACYKRLHPHHRGQHLGSLPGFLGCVCVCVSACLRVCLCVCVFVHGVLTDQIHASLLLSGFLVRSGLLVFLGLVVGVCLHVYSLELGHHSHFCNFCCQNLKVFTV